MLLIGEFGANLVSRTKLLRWTLFSLIIAGAVLTLLYRDRLDVEAVQEGVSGMGIAAPLAFMGLYALAAVLFVPGSILTISGGVLFGPVLGTLYSLTGATLGAILAFLIARYLASEWVACRSDPRLKQLMEGVEDEGWRFVAFVRLVPLFPFNLANYALGLTRIPWLHYALATYVCMLPGAIAYTYLGYVGREALAGNGDVIQKGLMALGLLAVVFFLPGFIRRFREQRPPIVTVTELKNRLVEGKDTVILDVRSSGEFHSDCGHIAGAKNIALENLQRRLHELQAYRNRSIAIICHTHHRSLLAARLLMAAGFPHVAVVRGGVTEWRRCHLPLESGEA